MVLTDDQLRQVRDLLLIEINQGLKKETNPVAAVKCFPTYVRELPNGEGNQKVPLKRDARVHR